MRALVPLSLGSRANGAMEQRWHKYLHQAHPTHPSSDEESYCTQQLSTSASHVNIQSRYQASALVQYCLIAVVIELTKLPVTVACHQPNWSSFMTFLGLKAEERLKIS